MSGVSEKIIKEISRFPFDKYIFTNKRIRIMAFGIIKYKEIFYKDIISYEKRNFTYNHPLIDMAYARGIQLAIRYKNNGYEKVFKTDTFWSNSAIFWAKGMQKANLFLYNQLKKRLPKKELQ